MAYPYPSRNRQIFILVAIAAIAIPVTVVALYTVMLQNPGNVTNIQTVGIEVYWDTSQTNTVSTINWGSIEPGTAKKLTIYLLNNGNTDIMLSMNTTNWSPENASEYVTLNWDYESQTLSSNQLLTTNLTLNVSPNAQGVTSFTFDIIISATEHS